MWIKRYLRKQINHVVPNKKKNNIRILVHAVVPKILIREFVLRKITLKQLITLILPRISKSVGRSVPIITSIYLKLKLAEKYGCCHLFLACLFDIFFYIKENDMLKYSFYYYNSMSQIIVAFHTLNSLDTIDA